MALRLEERFYKAKVDTTGTTLTTLIEIDTASFGGSNLTDCTIFVRHTIVMYETSGGTYSTAWELCSVYRRTTSGNPTLVGSAVAGNAGSGGQVGAADTSTFTHDNNATAIRLRVTPQSGTKSWFVTTRVFANEPV